MPPRGLFNLMQRFGWHLPASQPWRLYGDGLYGRELCFNGIGGTEMNAWLVFAIPILIRLATLLCILKKNLDISRSL